MAEARGRPRNALDMIVAAVAQANDCVVVTNNEKDFTGVEIFNPIRGGKAQRQRDCAEWKRCSPFRSV